MTGAPGHNAAKVILSDCNRSASVRIMKNPVLPMKKTIVWMLLLCLVPATHGGPSSGYVLYRDDDPAASYLGIPPGGRQAVRQALNAAIRKNPHNSVALSHRAYLFVIVAT